MSASLGSIELAIQAESRDIRELSKQLGKVVKSLDTLGKSVNTVFSKTEKKYKDVAKEAIKTAKIIKQTGDIQVTATSGTKLRNAWKQQQIAAKNSERQFLRIQKGMKDYKDETGKAGVQLVIITRRMEELRKSANRMDGNLTTFTSRNIEMRKQLALVNLELQKENINLNNVTKGAGGFNDKITNLSKSIQVALGPLSGVASRLTAMASLANRNTATIAGLIGGIIALTAATTKAIKTGIEFEVQFAQLDNRARLLGKSFEYTGTQLIGLARALAKDTLTSSQEARKGILALSTATELTGDQFRRTLYLSQDLADTGFGNLITNARTLARVMNDPAQATESLRRFNIKLMSSEKMLVEALVKSGQEFKAREIILDKLSSVQGNATAANKSLAFALDTLNDTVLDFTERSATQSGVLHSLTEAVNMVNDALQDLINNTKVATSLSETMSAIVGTLAKGFAHLITNVELVVISLAALVGAGVWKILKGVVGLVIVAFKSLSDAWTKNAATGIRVTKVLGSLISRLNAWALAISVSAAAWALFSDGTDRAGVLVKDFDIDLNKVNNTLDKYSGKAEQAALQSQNMANAMKASSGFDTLNAAAKTTVELISIVQTKLADAKGSLAIGERAGMSGSGLQERIDAVARLEEQETTLIGTLKELRGLRDSARESMLQEAADLDNISTAAFKLRGAYDLLFVSGQAFEDKLSGIRNVDDGFGTVQDKLRHDLSLELKKVANQKAEAEAVLSKGGIGDVQIRETEALILAMDQYAARITHITEETISWQLAQQERHDEFMAGIKAEENFIKGRNATDKLLLANANQLAKIRNAGMEGTSVDERRQKAVAVAVQELTNRVAAHNLSIRGTGFELQTVTQFYDELVAATIENFNAQESWKGVNALIKENEAAIRKSISATDTLKDRVKELNAPIVSGVGGKERVASARRVSGLRNKINANNQAIGTSGISEDQVILLRANNAALEEQIKEEGRLLTILVRKLEIRKEDADQHKTDIENAIKSAKAIKDRTKLEFDLGKQLDALKLKSRSNLNLEEQRLKYVNTETLKAIQKVEKYNESLKGTTEALIDVGKATAVIAAQAGKTFDELQKLQQMKDIIADIEAIYTNAADGIIELLREGGDATRDLKDIVHDVLGDIQEMILRTFVFDPIKKAIMESFNLESGLLKSIISGSAATPASGGGGFFEKIAGFLGFATKASFTGSAAAGGMGSMEAPIFSALGANFKVGGAGPTDSKSFNMALTPGEMVRITPRGQTDSGGGGNTTIILDLRGSNGDASIEAAVARGIAKAAPMIVGKSVQTVRENSRRSI